jgi:hypothetical protein
MRAERAIVDGLALPAGSGCGMGTSVEIRFPIRNHPSVDAKSAPAASSESLPNA